MKHIIKILSTRSYLQTNQFPNLEIYVSLKASSTQKVLYYDSNKAEIYSVQIFVLLFFPLLFLFLWS